MVLFAGVTAAAFSQVADKEDFDNYHLPIDTGWHYSDPSGSLHGSASTDNTSIDFNKDLGFNSYSTFSGKADWKCSQGRTTFTSR
jgi:Zn-dependent M28 family amino/carboxypeptidase